MTVLVVAALVLGALMVVGGAYLWFPPLALIAGGAELAGFALLVDDGKS